MGATPLIVIDSLEITYDIIWLLLLLNDEIGAARYRESSSQCLPPNNINVNGNNVLENYKLAE